MSIQNLLIDKLNLIYKLIDNNYIEQYVINDIYIEISKIWFNNSYMHIYFCNDDISIKFEIFILPRQQTWELERLKQYLIDCNITNEFLLMLDEFIIKGI